MTKTMPMTKRTRKTRGTERGTKSEDNNNKDNDNHQRETRTKPRLTMPMYVVLCV